MSKNVIIFSFLLFSFFLYEIRKQEDGAGPAWGERIGTSGREEVVGRRGRKR
jgi:hypothetical protein